MAQNCAYPCCAFNIATVYILMCIFFFLGGGGGGGGSAFNLLYGLLNIFSCI